MEKKNWLDPDVRASWGAAMLRRYKRFLRLGLWHVANPAVLYTVGEIHDQPDNQPDDQACPVYPTQLVHHVAVEQNAKKRHHRQPAAHENPGCAERPRLIGTLDSQHSDSNTNHNEGQQRADVHHLSDLVDGRNTAYDGCKDSDQYCVFVRSAEFRMNGREEFLWQQTVIGH